MESSDRLVTGSSGAASAPRSPDDDSATAAVIHSPGIYASESANVASASVNDSKAGVIALWLAVLAVLFSGIAFSLAIVATAATSRIADMAEQTGRAVAKAETATARANTAEIYAYQVYTELNRLGYPVRTPAEDHAPQPPNTPPAEREP